MEAYASSVLGGRHFNYWQRVYEYVRELRFTHFSCEALVGGCEALLSVNDLPRSHPARRPIELLDDDCAEEVGPSIAVVTQLLCRKLR